MAFLALVESVPADAIANGGWVFIITGKHCRSLILGNLGEATCGHGVYGMAVDRIESKTDILIDAITLGTIFTIATDP